MCIVFTAFIGNILHSNKYLATFVWEEHPEPSDLFIIVAQL